MAGTSADKLALLKATKEDMKAALIEKGQTPGDVFSAYPDMVRAIQTGVELPELTNPAAEGQVMNGYEFIDGNGVKKTGSVPTVEQATPSISVDVNGKITASATQSVGYVVAGTKSAEQQLTVQGATEITPSAEKQVAVPVGVFTTGDVVVSGDANLVPENIVSGKSIFGVAGSASAGGGTTVVSYTPPNTTTISRITHVIGETSSIAAPANGSAATVEVNARSLFVVYTSSLGNSARPTVTNATLITVPHEGVDSQGMNYTKVLVYQAN